MPASRTRASMDARETSNAPARLRADLPCRYPSRIARRWLREAQNQSVRPWTLRGMGGRTWVRATRQLEDAGPREPKLGPPSDWAHRCTKDSARLFAGSFVARSVGRSRPDQARPAGRRSSGQGKRRYRQACRGLPDGLCENSHHRKATTPTPTPTRQPTYTLV